MRILITGTLLVLWLDFGASMWLKQFDENYHRPTYYNSHHRSKQHVDYNRQALEDRDKEDPVTPRSLPPFDASTDLSFYVNVLNKGSVICAGALISRRMVITSTHCFEAPASDAIYEFSAKDMSILTGSEFGQNPAGHSVLAFYIPTNRREGRVNRAALLGLTMKLDKFTYRYIPLNRRRPKEGDRVKMAQISPPEYQIELYDTRVLDYDRCRVHYGLRDFFQVSTFEPDFFCVRNRRHSKKSTCATRPGDPLVMDNKLLGINIYGEHCDEEEDSINMDIYLPIRPVIPFIQTATDALRAFTLSGPYNQSLPTTVSPLIQSLINRSPNIYVGEHVPEILFDDPLNGGPPGDDTPSEERHILSVPDYY
ncbi:uncharacterized protein LOC108102274 [Drosophila ficusphila]|uniref:uncharacterized protein LOC108102274 n=1 Tax=Drosophila ficusphila TaxID=30025 RepID=UPI0007E6714D|nr:uncharacterized protein LOC108102274 [Drosophila ficusphila]